MNITVANVQTMTAAILEALGDPTSPLEANTLKAFRAGDYATVDALSGTDMGNHYLRSLSYLGSAQKTTGTGDPIPGAIKILREASSAAADHAREQTLRHLSGAMEQSFSLGRVPATAM